MSENTLDLILQRLDWNGHEQTQRFELLDQRLGLIEQRLELIEQNLERSEQRFALNDHERSQRTEPEQTRLRADILDQMERVFGVIRQVREDVTAVIAHAARADSATDATATIQRSLQSQLGQLRSRVERLEGKRDEPG